METFDLNFSESFLQGLTLEGHFQTHLMKEKKLNALGFNLIVGSTYNHDFGLEGDCGVIYNLQKCDVEA